MSQSVGSAAIRRRAGTVFLLGGLLALASAAQALVCATPGKDGVGTNITGVVNTYYPGTASAAAGATTLSLGASQGAATQITAGDLLLVIQMQDATLNTANTNAYGSGGTSGSGATAVNAGKFEYVVATAASNGSGNVTIRGDGTGGGLINSYASSAYSTASGAKTFQVIRVPQYSSATLGAALTSPAWNGATGGVVAVSVAGTFNLNGGGITTSGLGFRGGGGRGLTGGTGGTGTDYDSVATNNFHAQKGEGVAGTPRYLNNAATNALTDTTVEGYPGGSSARGAPGNAGGGGTDSNPAANDQNTGGGGGAGGGAGGQGGNAWSSSATVGGIGGTPVTASVSRLLLGGGGGAGTTNNSTGTPANGFASSGAAGGGLVMVRAGQVSGSGSITASGSNANNTVANDGSGGGGAGGSVLVVSPNALPAGLSITASGGTGGTNTGAGAPHGPGGGGGGGAVVLSDSNPGVTVTGGAAGTTSGNSNFGAVAGSAGTAVTTAGATQVPGASSTTTACQPTLTVVKTTSTALRTRGTDTTATYTITVSNSGGTASGVSVTDALPTPFAYNGAAVTPNYSGGASGPASVTGTGTTTAAFGTAGGDTTNSFTLPQGGSVGLTFTVNLGNAAAGTYQNPATTTYTDPTRTASGQTVTPGGPTASGGTAGGSNYASASSTGEDVLINAPPTTANVTNNVVFDNAGAIILNPNLSAADSDGTIASYTIATLPPAASGVLALNGTAVTAGQTFNANQLAQLSFDPAAGYSGNASFTYSATDNRGAVSNTSTYTIPVSLNPTPPATCPANRPVRRELLLNPPTTYSENSDTTPANPTTIPLIANSATFGTGTGSGGVFVVDANWSWSNGTPEANSTLANMTLVVNGTDYARLSTTADGSRTAGNLVALNGATVAGITQIGVAAAGAPGSNGSSYVAYFVTLPTSVTSISTAVWRFNITPITGATGDDIAVQAVHLYGCAAAPTTSDVTNAVLLDTAAATVLNPNLSAADTDGTIASYTIVTLPTAASGVLSVNGAAVTAGQTFTAAQLGTLTFKPTAGFNGNASFTYSATDNQGLTSNTSTYTIPVNVAPVANNDTSSTPANTAKTFSITGNDTDTNPGTVNVASTLFSTTGQPNGSTLSNGNRTIAVPNEGTYTLDNNGNVTFTPVSGYSGTTTAVKYTVQDNQGATSNVANITVTVTPVANNDTANTAPSTLVNIPVLNNDIGSNKSLTSLLFPATGQPNGSTVSNGGKTLTNADGTYTIKTNGTVDFTPALGKTGTLTPVLYTFQDGTGQTSNTATITVTVSNIVPPTATNDSKTTPKNTPVTLEGSTNDTANSLPIDNASVVFPTTGQPGTATVSNGGKTLTVTGQGTYQVQTNGTVTFTPVSTFAGTATPVYYTVKDTSGATSNPASLNVTVTNQPPTANNVTNTLLTSTSAAVALNPGVSGSDPDGNVVTYTVTTLPTAAMGTLYCNGTAIASAPSNCAPAQLTFKPNPTFNGNATFQYTVTDDNGATSSAATYTIPVNVPPVANNDSGATDPNVNVTFSITGNDTDTSPGTVDVTTTTFDPSSTGTISNNGKTLTVANQGVFTLDNSGNVTFAPAAGFNNGTSTAKYTVKDNNGAVSNVATITVTVPASVDLAITKTGPAYFKPGDTLSYTLTVTNTGSAATGVNVTDTLPSGLTFASASNGGTYNAGTGKVTWSLGNVAKGSTTTLTLTGTAPTAASTEANNGPTSLANSASVAGNETEVVTNNNSASTTAQLVYPKLTKRVRNVTQNGAFGTVGTGKPGEALEYCIDFKNYGVGVSSFVISDSVPSNTNASLSGYGAGLGLQVTRGNATTTRTSTSGDTDGGSLSATALSLDLGTLAAGESGTVCFQASIK